MKAQLRIVRTEVPQARIRPLGGSGMASIGHQFDFLPTVKVDKRSFGALSGDSIDVPVLEWKERIEWFSADVPVRIGTRGQIASSATWKYEGKLEKNMYAENSTSNTFKAWHSLKFFWACNMPNTPLPGLKDCLKAPDPDKAAKHWIAAHGCEWKIPS